MPVGQRLVRQGYYGRVGGDVDMHQWTYRSQPACGDHKVSLVSNHLPSSRKLPAQGCLAV